VGESWSRGMADVIRSEGRARLDTSEAAINMTEARKKEIENRKQWTETYFDMRRINREARAAERGPKRTKEDWIRFAQAGKPQRLSPSELDSVAGKLSWPILLRKDEFAKERAIVDQAFANRATTGTISPEDYEAVRKATDTIAETMKKDIKKISSLDYITAKRFLKSITYESRQPAG
ncbi:MAG: hypothetical protein JXM70_17790, partial [Pirellulales bacterium]|nr:hypothetical protein [Pirellulales bacterium]